MIEISLLIFIIVREALHQYSMHKMINKMMSRNFAEYQSLVDKVKLEELNVKNTKLNIPVEEYEPESDLALLEGVR